MQVKYDMTMPECPACHKDVVRYNSNSDSWGCSCGIAVSSELRVCARKRIFRYLEHLDKRAKEEGKSFFTAFFQYNIKPNYTEIDEALNHRIGEICKK